MTYRKDQPSSLDVYIYGIGQLASRNQLVSAAGSPVGRDSWVGFISQYYLPRVGCDAALS